MDPRVALLKDFSKGFIQNKAKIEGEQFGFAFLEALLSNGSELEYGELTGTRLLHRYKVVDIAEHKMEQFLQLHVFKQLNVCRYFGAEKNDVLCFNLDNNHLRNNTEIIPQLSLALDSLKVCLLEVGCEPMIVASGRGYHVWLRLGELVENRLLYDFMIAAAARALLPLLIRGDDRRAVKISFYPDIKVVEAVSLRLFGSEHAKTGVFSHVLTPDGLLDEGRSWKYFEDFVRGKATSTATLRSALSELRKAT
jgi:hypothetical protein